MRTKSVVNNNKKNKREFKWSISSLFICISIISIKCDFFLHFSMAAAIRFFFLFCERSECISTWNRAAGIQFLRLGLSLFEQPVSTFVSIDIVSLRFMHANLSTWSYLSISFFFRCRTPKEINWKFWMYSRPSSKVVGEQSAQNRREKKQSWFSRSLSWRNCHKKRHVQQSVRTKRNTHQSILSRLS